MANLLPEKWTPGWLSRVLNSTKSSAARLEPNVPEKRLLQLPVPMTPFEHYQRNKLIKFLRIHELVEGASVLEIGCGIGDVLLEISRHKPNDLYGVDKSATLINFAKQLLQGINVDLQVLDSLRLPFPEKSFDVVFMIFELQYLSEEKDLEKMIFEATRVTRRRLILVEHTSPVTTVQNGYITRPVKFYEDEFLKKKFLLRKTAILDDVVTRFVFAKPVTPWHWLRWFFSPLLYLLGFPKSWLRPPLREMAPPRSRLAIFLQKISLPLFSEFDKIFLPESGITVMHFERKPLFKDLLPQVEP